MTQVVPMVHMVQLGMHWEHMFPNVSASFPHGNTCSHAEGTMLLITFVVVIGYQALHPSDMCSSYPLVVCSF